MMNKTLRMLHVKVESEPGQSKIKRIEFGGFPAVVRMGLHAGFSQFFKLTPEEPMPSTLDYMVAAIAGCLTGTLAAALERRGISANPDLQAEADGHLEEIDGKLLLTGITVKYKLKVPKELRTAAERALQHHDAACPASASARRGIAVQWSADIEDE
jgi:organic hydroperoxide reductase OsmC/OhrA